MTERLAADAAGIVRAAALLRAGRLVAFATETVYGLGADATNGEAVAAIFAAKERPRFNPLICHYQDADHAFANVLATPLARRLADAFWPGPLSLVLRRRDDCAVALLASAGLDTLALRVPAHAVALDLLRAVAVPVAAPSANRSGHVSPTTAEHVLAELDGRIDAVLDGGASPVGVESTVLDVTGERPALLRPGGTTREAIELLVGPVADASAPGAETGRGKGALRSPGLLVAHYSPRLPVRLDAVAVARDEALLAFGEPLPGAGLTFNMSEAGDLTEAAARLFAGLRSLDAEGTRQGLVRIAAMPVPETGLGRAIGDRLRRAAGLHPGPTAR
jgi:L-threonylcarbamoyladenylate synthase